MSGLEACAACSPRPRPGPGFAAEESARAQKASSPPALGPPSRVRLCPHVLYGQAMARPGRLDCCEFTSHIVEALPRACRPAVRAERPAGDRVYANTPRRWRECEAGARVRAADQLGCACARRRFLEGCWRFTEPPGGQRVRLGKENRPRGPGTPALAGA